MDTASLTTQTKLSTTSLSTLGTRVKVEDFMVDVHKRAFACAFVRDPADSWAAARKVWPHNVEYALYCHTYFPQDPEVISYVVAVQKDVGREALELPSAHEYTKYVWDCAQNEMDGDRKLKYVRLYAELQGSLKRPQGADTEVNITQNKVMIATDFGKKALSQAVGQQAGLQEMLGEISVDMDDDDEF